MESIARRKLMQGGAALAVAAAVPAAVKAAQAEAGDGELAALVKLYFEQLAEFNATDHKTDRESNRHAATTYEKTRKQMIGVPARSAEDAIAAIDFLVKESEFDTVDLSVNQVLDEDANLWMAIADEPMDPVAMSLVKAVRGYLEGRVA
jgi:hypothetical protein